MGSASSARTLGTDRLGLFPGAPGEQEDRNQGRKGNQWDPHGT